ncbi:hypothetical protein SFSGTM_14490 [Sulfuriferula nivalis]|uniref:Sel1 repeat family protein n=1 Tax=Sulfuriferula nivalis TaxID=2675298 RepID=A0A809RPI1_9PROT|nr:hypothetical protein SFSGTM_14490 [Sulfuriferula nivalis]
MKSTYFILQFLTYIATLTFVASAYSPTNTFGSDITNNSVVLRINSQDNSENLTKLIGEYRQSAERGSASAQYNLGVLYDTGRGVVQSYTTALKLYRKRPAQPLQSLHYLW